MHIITRYKFLDISLGPEEISAWVVGWVGWRRAFLAGGAVKQHAEGAFRIDFTLSGYPQNELPLKATEWREKLSEEWFEKVAVGEGERGDAVVAESIVMTDRQAPVVELLRPLFCGLADGMATMIELVTWEGGEVTPKTTHEVLILYGLIQREKFLVKAVWPKGLPYDDGHLYQSTVWPEEANAVAGLTNFRNAFEATRNAQMACEATFAELSEGVKSVFSPMAIRQGALFVRVLFGGGQVKEDLGSFLKRAGGLFAATALLTALFLADIPMRFLCLLGAVLCGVGFVVAVGWKGYIAWMMYTLMKKSFARIYNEPWSGVEVIDAEATWAAQPTFRKLSADAAALGGEHSIDLRFAETKTYLFVMFLLENPDGGKSFPANPTFLARTLYENNVAVATMSQGLSFKKRLDKRSCRKLFKNVTGVADMLARHERVVKGFAPPERGPLVFSKEEFVRHEIAEHEEDSERNRKYGYYRLIDAIGETFGLMRPDLVEKH